MAFLVCCLWLVICLLKLEVLSEKFGLSQQLSSHCVADTQRGISFVCYSAWKGSGEWEGRASLLHSHRDVDGLVLFCAEEYERWNMLDVHHSLPAGSRRITSDTPPSVTLQKDGSVRRHQKATVSYLNIFSSRVVLRLWFCQGEVKSWLLVKCQAPALNIAKVAQPNKMGWWFTYAMAVICALICM